MKYKVTFYEGYECTATVDAESPEEVVTEVLSRNIEDYEQISKPHVTTIYVYIDEQHRDQNDPIVEWDECGIFNRYE